MSSHRYHPIHFFPPTPQAHFATSQSWSTIFHCHSLPYLFCNHYAQHSHLPLIHTINPPSLLGQPYPQPPPTPINTPHTVHIRPKIGPSCPSIWRTQEPTSFFSHHKHCHHWFLFWPTNTLLNNSYWFPPSFFVLLQCTLEGREAVP
jgi:hypothetical protein